MGKFTGFPFHLPGGDVGVAVGGGEYRQEGFKLAAGLARKSFVGSVPVQDINVGPVGEIGPMALKSASRLCGPQMKIPCGLQRLTSTWRVGSTATRALERRRESNPKVTLRLSANRGSDAPRHVRQHCFVAPTLFRAVRTDGHGLLYRHYSSPGSAGSGAGMFRLIEITALVPSTAESYTAGFVYSSAVRFRADCARRGSLLPDIAAAGLSRALWRAA